VAEPGWYNDDSDDALARWHDGSGWTEHTIVKAQWAGPGMPPPPAAPEPEPTAWIPSTSPLPAPPIVEAPPAAQPPRPALTDRYRAWPLWARIAAPATAGLIAIGAATGGSDKPDTVSSTGTTALTVAFDPVDQAVEAANDAVAIPVTDIQMRRLVSALCDERASVAAADALDVTREPAELEDLIEGAGVGVAQYCGVAGHSPTLLNDVYRQAIAQVTPATTQPPATTTVAAAQPFSAPAQSTATTKAPPVTQAPVAQPPTTQASPPSGTYYENCTAARAAGAAPVHIGDPGYGSHLDSDHDGIGCE
jgi:hypothetical protein